MDKLLVKKSPPLVGEIHISGAKNAALPIMAATLLASETVELKQLPSLRDVSTMVKLLETMGASVSCCDDGEGDFVFDASNVAIYVAPYDLVKTMRASILVLGPLLARFGRAVVSLPGGCAIGGRPVQLHLDALRAMGATIEVQNGYITGRVDGRLRGARIVFDTITVTGTENILMAACLAEGESILENCAKEPEVVDLANFLVSLGASIEGIGTGTMRVQGSRVLGGGQWAVIPDRVEAGTYLVAAAATGGCVSVSPVVPAHIEALIQKLRESGAEVTVDESSVTLDMQGRLPRAVSITTHPFPGFPTDMQAQFMVLNCVAEGASVVTENIFENRFMHVQELVRMGADISVNSKSAMVAGGATLQGAPVMATDLRASACLVIAGLVAEGETLVDRIYHLDRGYELIEEKLQGVGALIERVRE